MIGDTTRLSERFQERIRELEAASAKNDGLNLQIAINYGSRDEMTRAMRRMSEDVAAGKKSRKRSRKVCLRSIWIPQAFRIRIF